MFGEQISRSPRIASPWSARLSTSASTSASTTAPPTPPPHHASAHTSSLLTYSDEEDTQKHQRTINNDDEQLPALHLLNMSCDDALSDVSDEADGFFSLDMDVSIDQQLQNHDSIPSSYQHAHSNGHGFGGDVAAVPSLNQRFDPSPSSGSPLLNPALRRASETVAYSSSPLQNVGLDPVMASRSRNSPVLKGVTSTPTTNANASVAIADSPSSFGPIAPEVDQKGNLEYKLKILPPSRERFDRLVTQLKWRLLEGGGLAVYEIGVLDDGTLIGLDPDSMKDSLKLLSLMAAEVGASCQIQRVLALEKVPTDSNGHDTAASSIQSASHTNSSRLAAAAAESDLSLRALAPAEAEHTLNPYILTVDMNENTRSQLLDSGLAGLYRFDIAEQQSTSIPPPLTAISNDDPAASSSSVAVKAVDPSDSAVLDNAQKDDDIEPSMSAQTKRRLLKSTHGGLPTCEITSASTVRPKKDVLQGRDQSAIVYLPSKEEKRILRAAAAAAEYEAELEHQQTEARERKLMAKMTRVADTIQPKTARARARARKSAANANANGDSGSGTPSPSPTPSPAMKPTTSIGAYTGYETVMSHFGVLSERAAKLLYANQGDLEDELAGMTKGRLIVEAVVRRDAGSPDNYVDYQGARAKLRLDEV